MGSAVGRRRRRVGIWGLCGGGGDGLDLEGFWFRRGGGEGY